MRLRCFGLAAALVVIILINAPGVWSQQVGPVINIYTGPNNQWLEKPPSYSPMAYDPAMDRFLVAWNDKAETLAIDIWARFVGGDGSPQGDAFPICTTPPQYNYQHYRPGVVFDSNNRRFLAFWADNRNGYWATYGAFVDADTATVHDEFPISPLYDPTDPDKFWLSAGPIACLYDQIADRFLVIAVDSPAAPYNLWGAFLGTSDWFKITDYTSPYGLWRAAAAFDSINRHFMVAYASNVGYDIIVKETSVKILGADGGTLSTYTVSPDTGYALTSAAFDPINDQFLVLWDSPLHAPQGAVLDATGNPLRVDVAVEHDTQSFDATFDAANQRYLVVGNHSGPSTVVGQQLDLDGNPYADWFPIAQVALSRGGFFVASGSPGKALVIWSDSEDIFGAIVENVPPAPVVSLSSASLSFAPQPVNTTSGPQTVALTNTGSADLTITSITPSGDFSQSNDCTSPIAAGGTCIISVSFTPTVAGTRSGTITITDNTAAGTHAISLSGTGTDFSVSASPNPQTVKVGKSTTYSLSVAPSNGFTGTIALSCSGVPAGAACSISPASVTLNSTNPAQATATVKTSTGKKGTSTGTYTLTFTGVSNTLGHSTTATLVVVKK